jgi:DNA-directed RNA polymerase subunit D
VFKVEKGKLVVGDIYKCSMCKLCTEACDAGAIDIGSEDRTFVFTVETDGSYNAHDMILNAMKSIKGKAEQLSQIMDAL